MQLFFICVKLHNYLAEDPEMLNSTYPETVIADGNVHGSQLLDQQLAHMFIINYVEPEISLLGGCFAQQSVTNVRGNILLYSL